jgi:hypothetical protein
MPDPQHCTVAGNVLDLDPLGRLKKGKNSEFQRGHFSQ